MKKLYLIAFGVGLLGLMTVPAAFAGKEKRDKRAALPDVFAQFDKNGNGVLDPDEKEAIRKAYAEGNPDLKAYDKNNDGKLDDDEIAAIQPASVKKHKKNR